MVTKEFLKECVMNAIADDYENLEHIIPWTTKLLEQRGSVASRREILEALQKIVEGGYAQAYRLSPHEPYSTPVDFSLKQADTLWFYLTPKGLEVVKNTDELGRLPPAARHSD